MKVTNLKVFLMFFVALVASFFLLASGYAIGNFESAHATKVYIDAGHGGGDSGAVGNGYQEKNLTADMARRVESAIKAKRYDLDTYVNISGIPYYNRGSDAASRGCDIFVSLHMNSSGASSATGTESYVYRTASKRNAHSIDLQNALHDRLVKATGLLNRGKKQEDFAVCRAPMPSVLLEMAFISNPNDVRLFLLRRSAIANAIADGIAAFSGTSLPKVYSSLDGSWAKENGKWCFKNKNGKKYKNSWLVTSTAPGSKSPGDYQRYYLDANGFFPSAGTHNINLVGKNSWFYFTNKGHVLRGFYDNGAARVFVADNDGRLAEPQAGERKMDGSGWLITGKYTNGDLQRYYIDGQKHAVVSALYQVDGKTYFGQGGVGFCFRNCRFDWEGKTYSANNDGVLKDVTTKWAKVGGKWVFYRNGSIVKNDWVVTDLALGTNKKRGLERYYIDANGNIPAQGAYKLRLAGKTSWFYVMKSGLILRGFYDNGAARVYVADNDGRLAEPQNGERRSDGSGWLITGKYTNGDLQRYYVDGATHAVKSAIYEVDGATYFGQGGVGFCFRNGRLDWEGKSYLANNDGILIENSSIMGYSMTSVSQMVRRYNSMEVKYPSSVYSKYGASNITEFCKILMSEAKAEGVRAEVVFAQAMHETGWLKFGGDVKADQCNFAGIGATGNGARGNSFNSYGTNSVRMGLRAQIQHLKAYASTEPLKNQTIDPRFQYVKRGSARTVYALGGKWATGSGYGTALMKQMNALLAS